MSDQEWTEASQLILGQNKSFSHKHAVFLLTLILLAIFAVHQYLNNQTDLYRHQIDELEGWMTQQQSAAAKEKRPASDEVAELLAGDRRNMILLRQISVDLVANGFCLEAVAKKNRIWHVQVLAQSYQGLFKRIEQWQARFPEHQFIVHQVKKNKQGSMSVDIKIKNHSAGLAHYVKRKSKELF